MIYNCQLNFYLDTKYTKMNCSYVAIKVDGSKYLIENISLYVSGANTQCLLEDTDLKIVKNTKYGLIGPNGYGKSTLLKSLSTDDLPLYKNITGKISYLEQEQETETLHSDKSIIDYVLENNPIFCKEQELLSIFDNTGESQELNKFYEQFPQALQLESTAQRMLFGIGFTDTTLPCCSFSGGWITRASLIKTLLLEPEILLLDEPTNHLDIDATIWLENYLKNYKKTMILVSHNRRFLDQTCDKIIRIHNKKLVYYNYNFENYIKQKAIEEKQQDEKYNLDRKKFKSRKERIAARPQRYNPKLTIVNDNEEEDYVVIKAENVTFSYDDKLILENVNFSIGSQERYALIGPNGQGKSTFLNVLSGVLTPNSGNITIHKSCKIAKYDQHFADILPCHMTATEFLSTTYNIKIEEARSWLGKFGLINTVHNNLIKTCSGGQKARILLASIQLQKPDVLLLDEPSNNLDMETIDALISALSNFNGAVLLVSHDIYLIESLECKLLLCEDKKIIEYDNDIEDYVDYVIEKVENKEIIQKNKRVISTVPIISTVIVNNENIVPEKSKIIMKPVKKFNKVTTIFNKK